MSGLFDLLQLYTQKNYVMPGKGPILVLLSNTSLQSEEYTLGLRSRRISYIAGKIECTAAYLNTLIYLTYRFQLRYIVVYSLAPGLIKDETMLLSATKTNAPQDLLDQVIHHKVFLHSIGNLQHEARYDEIAARFARESGITIPTILITAGGLLKSQTTFFNFLDWLAGYSAPDSTI
jgi:hypothetical protein